MTEPSAHARVSPDIEEEIRTATLWFEQQIENAQQDQISGFAAKSEIGTLRGERAHARHCAMYEAQQMFLRSLKPQDSRETER